MHAYGSLIKNLLRTFFKFTSSFVVQLLLFGHRGCAVLRLSPGWRVSRWCISHLRLLPVRGVVGLLRHATLVKSLCGRILLGACFTVVGGSSGGSCVLLSSGLLSDNVQYTVLEGLFVLAQPVLLPGVVVNVAVEVVSPHAVDEETFAGSVVGLLFEFERAAVLHELSEL